MANLFGNIRYGFQIQWLIAAAILWLAGTPYLSAQDTADEAEENGPKIVLPYFDLRQHDGARANLIQSSSYMRATAARSQYSVNGAGLTAAILDTGLRTSHVDFAGRMLTQKNFTTDNSGNQNNAWDGHGHGTNVGGIVCANSVNIGFAPGASIIPVKVIMNNNTATWESIQQGLDWVIANAGAYNISVVNMSLGAAVNLTSEPSNDASYGGLRSRIQTLRSMNIPVVISAGNGYGDYNTEGMGYPAIIRESISVGAVFDADIGGPWQWGNAIANTTGAGRFVPFSQRLHSTTNSLTQTDVFATGSLLTSSGILSDTGTSDMSGTSQAAPCIAGTVLLGQEYYKRVRGQLPAVDDLERWLRSSPYTKYDGDDENDNVANTQKSYVQADCLDFVQKIASEIGGGQQAPAITSATSVGGAAGTSFTYQITATNNPTSYNASGLPAGLSVNQSTGLISGILPAAGSYIFTVSASNTSGTGSAQVSLGVYTLPTLNPPVITSAGSVTVTAGTYFEYQIQATNSPSSFDMGGYPSGLSFNSSSGILAGYVSEFEVGYTYYTYISATNSAGTGISQFTISVAPAVSPVPVITSSLYEYATQGYYYNYQIQATGNPTSYGASGLPYGLNVDSLTGNIYGYPQQSGTFYVTIWASNSSGTGYANLSLTINQPCTSPCPLVCTLDAAQTLIEGLIPRVTLPAPFQKLLSSVRNFRDQALLADPEGRKLASLYYGHGCELASQVLANPQFIQNVKQLIEDLEPALNELSTHGQTKIPSETWNRGWAMIDQVAEGASPKLQQDLQLVRDFLLKRRVVEGDFIVLRMAHSNVAQQPPHRAATLASSFLPGIELSGIALLALLGIRRRTSRLPQDVPFEM